MPAAVPGLAAGAWFRCAGAQASESPETASDPTATDPPRCDARPGRPSRLTQVAVWVGIIAGVVFIVAVVIFEGFLVAWTSGHGGNDGYFASGAIKAK
ncbi:hypothetical protein [Mycobacterium basiliense]|uniref:hypothetical protein n=1 Tax=Mycobacterium basiliense TaxID=2094119 RepID=UPI0013010B80|nr:hypothetical protein [Mycobacterium basiliense]